VAKPYRKDSSSPGSPGVFGALKDAIRSGGEALGRKASAVKTDKRDSGGNVVSRRQQQEDELLGLRRRQSTDHRN
jgi:hypothetical protein